MTKQVSTSLGSSPMTAAGRMQPLEWQAYLDGEERAQHKHEYVCGFVYAMAGAKYQHNRIASNLLIAIGRRLQSPCEVVGSDQKVRIRTSFGYRFYYPDCTVVCGKQDPELPYSDNPTVVVEVLSPSTRRLDEGEKREGYLAIPSLAAYLLVDSERAEAALWRRHGAEFKKEIFEGTDASIPLPEIDMSLPLAEVYANVEWREEPGEE
jgi:Uma2 family endonuclease